MNHAELLKATDRALWYRKMGAGIVGDVVLVLIGLYAVSGADGLTLLGFGAGMLILWGVQAVLGLKTWLTSIISVHYLEGKLLQANFLQILRINKLPPPVWRARRFDYLVELADDEDVPADARVRAASVYAVWTTVMRLRGIAATLVMASAWDKAIEQYDEEVATTP